MRRTRVRILIALLLLLGLGAFWAHRSLKAHGHPGLPTLLGQLVRNYPKSFAAEPPVLEINVDEAAMERLQAVVDQARERGVILPEGNEFVQAGINGPTGGFKAKVRIKGKMSDHVEGEKWSFRVVARKDGGFLGMKRFSLQHPGTRNYLTEWLHHRLMAGEGLVALRYGFCKVVFNGEDLGVYAYEEHFGPELLEHNGRMQGPLVRFDPSLFWQHRLNGVEGEDYRDGYGEQQAAALDAFGSGDLRKDSAANRVFEQAMTLMDAFRTGQLSASAVFDATRTGRRLAMLDLLGGHRSMDWSDVKFHFDPLAQRFEPVAYESVSGFRIEEIAGAFRVTGPPSPTDEFHTALLKDPVIFAAYVQALERYTKKEWLDSAFRALGGALDTASATLYGEFPYKELDRSLYYRNQRIMARALQLPKPFHAYAQQRSGDTLVF
ncbi:MAG TPA: CotH kinase family protein, partial [Flavobacteriales bacterium]